MTVTESNISSPKPSFTLELTKADRGLLCALGILCFLLYGNTMNYEFVTWDDPWYITNNTLIKSWSFENLYGICTENVARNYAPLTIFSFLVDHTLWGDWAGGYHMTNVLIHLLNSCLVYILLNQILKQVYRGHGPYQLITLVTTICFMIHPVQVETVAWVSSRKGLLSSIFMLMSLRCWWREDRTNREELGAIGYLIIALMCKANAIVLPGLFLSYDVLIRRQKIVEVLPRIMIPVTFCFLFLTWTATAQTTIVGGVREHIGMSKMQLLLIDSVLGWKYVGLLLWPTSLSILYDPPTQGISGQIILSLLGWIGVGLILLKTYPKSRWCVLATASILWLMFPVLNLFPLTTLMNDRYLYLPLIPFFAVLFGGILAAYQWAEHKIPQAYVRKFVLAVTIAFVMASLGWFGLLNHKRQTVFANSHNLWSTTVQQVPELTVVQIQWALTLCDEGRYAEAEATLKKALESNRVDQYDRERILDKLQSISTMDDLPQVNPSDAS
jgi:hypothetical protein